MKEKKRKEKERLEKEIDGTLANMGKNNNGNVNNNEHNNNKKSQDINMNKNANVNNSNNNRNNNGSNNNADDNGNESAGSGSVSVSDPEDMRTPASNGMSDRPEPAPNIDPKFTFLIKPKEQLKELTKEMLDNTADINKKKQLLGERLYHKVNDLGENQASKITGHILSLDIDVLFDLLSDNKALADKMVLAKKRIEENRKKQQQVLNEMSTMRNNLNDEIGNIHSQSNRENVVNPNQGNSQL